jgi:hypothetical protein
VSRSTCVARLGSHGVADLLPNRLDEEDWTLETTLAVDGRARTVRVLEGTTGHARVEFLDVQFVVQTVFTTSSKAVGLRSMRPAPRVTHARSSSAATSA